jgi:hypothetical protein
MQDKGSAKFTEDFIVKEMQKNWWISKENQLLFIRTHIYKEISSKYLYDWSDGDDNRLNEYTDAIEQIEECWKRFRNWYIAYTKQRSANARQQSADARQQSADARQQSIESTHRWLKEISNYYYLCKNNPNSINEDELSETKKYAKHVIQNCKKYGIDYKSKLTKEMLKFYGVE